MKDNNDLYSSSERKSNFLENELLKSSKKKELSEEDKKILNEIKEAYKDYQHLPRELLKSFLDNRKEVEEIERKHKETHYR